MLHVFVKNKHLGKYWVICFAFCLSYERNIKTLHFHKTQKFSSQQNCENINIGHTKTQATKLVENRNCETQENAKQQKNRKWQNNTNHTKPAETENQQHDTKQKNSEIQEIAEFKKTGKTGKCKLTKNKKQ